MQLSRYKIGDLISINNSKNKNNYDLPFYGINKNKEFMPTVANTNNLDKSKYKIMTKGRFVFSGMQTGRDNCIRIGLYSYDFDCLVSPAYTTFDVVSKEVLPEYLFMIFRSSEMDRYGSFLSDGSVRANLDWDVFCNIEIDVPSLSIQKKFVNLYLNMEKNINIISKEIDRLKYVYEANIDIVTKDSSIKSIGQLTKEIVNKNTNNEVKKMYGIGLNGFINPNQKRSDESLRKCNIFHKGDFVYAPSSIKNGVIEYNDNIEEAICSEEYIVFEINDLSELDPYYLTSFLKREEFGRYIDFMSIDSVRNRFYYNDLSKIDIPLPSIDIQKKIGSFYKIYTERKRRYDELSNNFANIIPVLVQGSIKEACHE